MLLGTVEALNQPGYSPFEPPSLNRLFNDHSAGHEATQAQTAPAPVRKTDSR